MSSFAFLTNHVLNTEWALVALGLGLRLISIVVFLVYFRTRRWM
jgi:hypothetical protein